MWHLIRCTVLLLLSSSKLLCDVCLSSSVGGLQAGGPPKEPIPALNVSVWWPWAGCWCADLPVSPVAALTAYRSHPSPVVFRGPILVLYCSPLCVHTPAGECPRPAAALTAGWGCGAALGIRNLFLKNSRCIFMHLIQMFQPFPPPFNSSLLSL